MLDDAIDEDEELWSKGSHSSMALVENVAPSNLVRSAYLDRLEFCMMPGRRAYLRWEFAVGSDIVLSTR